MARCTPGADGGDPAGAGEPMTLAVSVLRLDCVQGRSVRRGHLSVPLLEDTDDPGGAALAEPSGPMLDDRGVPVAQVGEPLPGAKLRQPRGRTRRLPSADDRLADCLLDEGDAEVERVLPRALCREDEQEGLGYRVRTAHGSRRSARSIRRSTSLAR